MSNINTLPTKLLDNATATGPGATCHNMDVWQAFQAYGSTTAGTGAAAIKIEGSNDGTHWSVVGDVSEMDLTLGTAETVQSGVSMAPWPYVRANVISISGTGAKVTVTRTSQKST